MDRCGLIEEILYIDCCFFSAMFIDRLAVVAMAMLPCVV